MGTILGADNFCLQKSRMPIGRIGIFLNESQRKPWNNFRIGLKMTTYYLLRKLDVSLIDLSESDIWYEKKIQKREFLLWTTLIPLTPISTQTPGQRLDSGSDSSCQKIVDSDSDSKVAKNEVGSSFDSNSGVKIAHLWCVVVYPWQSLVVSQSKLPVQLGGVKMFAWN